MPCDNTLEVSVSFKFCLIHTQFVKRQITLRPSIGKQNIQAIKRDLFYDLCDRLAILPVIFCLEVSTFVGCGSIMITAALYGVLAIGKK